MLWRATDKQQSHDLMANVEVAEDQPVAQIAAVQKKEHRKKKELPWMKSDGQPPARRHLILVMVA
jgi:hypothetical protein